MSEQMQERLSALVDGELADADILNLVDRVARDEELCRTWGRYHLIGDAMRGHRVAGPGVELGDRVMARLADEPTVLAPVAARGVAWRWVKPAVGAAVAASVAMLAVMVAPRFVGLSPHPGYAQAPAAEMYADRGGARWDVAEPAVESRLNNYLVDHSQNAVAGGVKGMLPYVTIVGYATDGR